MPGISAVKVVLPFSKKGFNAATYWATRLPYFALPTTGVSLMVGQEVTIYGDTLINVPIGNPLTVTYTCNIGTQIGNNLVITPEAGDIGNHSLRMVFKNGGYTIEDKTITIAVIAKATAGVKKILMLGDSIVNSGAGYFATKISASLDASTITYLGTQGTTTKHEGYSGASTNWFLTHADSPLVKAGALNVAAYFTDNSIERPDYVYIRLGINDLFGYCTEAQSGNIAAGITTLIASTKTLINAFLAYDANLKVIIGLPTITGATSVAWNLDYDESVYIQDTYINNMHRYHVAAVTEFANGEYNARVDCSYEVVNLDRAGGYAEAVNSGVHPIQAGYEQLGVGIALKVNQWIQTDLTNAFTTTWQTENAGSATKTVVIPVDIAKAYNSVIDWGDGTNERYIGKGVGDATHVYATTGIKTIRINGIFPQILFNGAGDRLKIISIERWGNIAWADFSGNFRGCANMVANFSDVPDTSAVIGLYAAFYLATVFNASLGAWDISQVTNANLVTHSSGINTANYDATLIGWAAQSVQPSLTVNFGSVKYSAGAAATARGVLDNAPNNWTITDGGQV